MIKKYQNKEYQKKWREEHPDYKKKWRAIHKKETKEYWKKYYITNRDKELERQRRRREENPEYIKEYQKKNKKEILEYVKEWRENNVEEMSEYQRKRYIENRKEKLEYCGKYKKTEKGKANNQRASSKRRAKIRTIINNLTSEGWLDILKKCNYKCAYCGKEFDLFNLPTRDHIIPISKGGDNTKENIIPACQSCNSKKGNKILIEKGKIYAT